MGLDDHILTLKLTPNRADCLSILGVAREVSALTKSKLEPVEIKPVPAKSKAKHPVKLSAPEGCGRFAGRVIRGVNAAAPDAGMDAASASSARGSGRSRRWSTSRTT